MHKRIDSLDFLRGISLILVVFFHTSVYNYANIHKINFNNPPIIVVIISFLVLWGGLLIFYSGIVNTIMFSVRIEILGNLKHANFLFIAGSIYIIIHYILNIFLGRWNVDFINNRLDMTVVASSIRNMQLTFPRITKFFEGSSLSTIGLNLIIVTSLLFFLLRNKGFEKEKRNYWVLGISGFIIMLFSFTRIYLYSIVGQSIQAKNYYVATILSFTIANPYPLLPYLAYGLFASIIGLMIYKKRKNLIKKVFIPIGLFFFIYGLVGCMNFPKTISKADYFWYFKTHLELGIFILTITFFLLTFEFRNKKIINIPFIKWFSRVSLTVYLFETLLSEIFGKILNYLIPAWNQTINGCLIFGALNIIIWILILWIWQKNNFKFSVEYWWMKIFRKLGKRSTKMDFPQASTKLY
ncbi:MAG: acyltransferase [Candidatus Atribacteria bacterium]|nr:acyltransferase [Candidatus Atribacteria bacterium]